MQLEAVGQALNDLAAADPFSYTDPESIIELQRQLAQHQCIVSTAVAVFDKAKEWAADGARTSVAWIVTRCHLSEKEARCQLRRGRALAHMPTVANAWMEGDIFGDHVDILAKARTPVTEAEFARDEELLVEKAKELKFAEFSSLLAYWNQGADPDGACESDMERLARRDVSLISSIDGMWFGKITLDPISGAIVSGELERLERELFEADWALARKELGREPKLHELARTPAQRRADALVEMAARSKIAPADGRRPRPLFTFLIGYDSFKGRISELAQGQVLSPDSILEWLDGADFERAIFAPGKRVEVSVTSRLFTGATRRAIELRDRKCTNEYCDLPADKCQIDHIIPYHRGGRTDQRNGRVHCGFHNRRRNHGPPGAPPPPPPPPRK
jgi:Domain of unknown function (DUF222)